MFKSNSNKSKVKQQGKRGRDDSRERKEKGGPWSTPGTEAAAVCRYCLALGITDSNGFTPTHSYNNCPNKARFYNEKGSGYRFGPKKRRPSK